MSQNNNPMIDALIIPRTHDIGGFNVLRALPFKDRRMVGPFIFWDQMGPGEFISGKGVDVRPHPHIGLSTVTYLFDGTMDHKDSLGNDMRIVPGDVNLMTAGAGIVHSERTGQDIRKHPSRLFGIQSWIAQPKMHEEGQPSFHHTQADQLAAFDDAGVSGRTILGNFLGAKSSVATQWETLYVDIHFAKGAKISIPNVAEEQALFPVKGSIELHHNRYHSAQMLVLSPKQDITITAIEDTRVLLFGGATMDGPRHIWWNFVSSNKERIEQAKRDWQEGKFATVPGDEKEFIPLPD